jgi:hypothetical protein
MATVEDVRRLCLSLPGVTERLSWEQPAWFAKTLMARMWEDGVVTVKTDERDALAASDPTPTTGPLTTTGHPHWCWCASTGSPTTSSRSSCTSRSGWPHAK